MTAEQILKELEEIFRDNFDDDDIVLTRETTADDIEDWDSLEQINLLTAIGNTLLGIDGPGTGIAFTVPFSSIGGIRELRFLTDGQNYEKGEESSLKDTTHELLVVIANQGYTDQVMDAAREQGAGGGTVIHAKGTGMQNADKFFGMTLAAEKDIIYIVARREQKNGIMKAVMEKAGVGTRAGAIVFSLPVTATAGMRQLED